MELSECSICGGAPGECNTTLMASIPLGIAGTPKGNGEFKSGRFYEVTKRVFVNNRLVHGVGTKIPWEEAVHLGLVEPLPEMRPAHTPIVDEPVPVQEPLPDTPENEELEPVTKPEIAAAVKRRKPSGSSKKKLGNVA